MCAGSGSSGSFQSRNKSAVAPSKAADAWRIGTELDSTLEGKCVPGFLEDVGAPACERFACYASTDRGGELPVCAFTHPRQLTLI